MIRSWSHVASVVLSALLFTLMCPGPARSSDQLATATVMITELKVVGDDIVSKTLLDELLPRYRNKLVSADELQAIAQQLTADLVAQGYVNSGVILPDQQVENGVVVLQVIAGRVGSVTISGNKRLSDQYIVSRLMISQDPPFKINDAVGRLQLLERNPRIQRLNAELKPSVVRGAAQLNVDVAEARAYGASIGVDNHISPNVGNQEATIDLYHLNLLGLGDTLTFNYRKAEGFSGGSAGYSIPLNAHDTSVAVNYSHNASKIVSRPFDRLDIEGATTSYGIALRQPLINSLRTELTMGVGLQKEQVESFLLGEPFSFSVSDQEGLSQATIVQFTQDWVSRTADRVFAIRSNIGMGVNALDASVGGEGDSRFVEWWLQSEWLRKVGWRNSTLGLKLQLHLSNDTLPAYRKFALGGASSVHGCRENLVTRDSGVAASIEWTLPVARLPVLWLSQNQSGGQVVLVPFVDYGYGWDYLRTLNEPVSLASVGVGVQWRLGKNSSVDIQLAKALIRREIPTYDKVPQDVGVHFGIRIGY